MIVSLQIPFVIAGIGPRRLIARAAREWRRLRYTFCVIVPLLDRSRTNKIEGRIFFQCNEPTRWLQEYGVVQRGEFDALQLGVDFLTTAWHIWKARNAWIFKGTATPAFGVTVQASTYSKCTIDALFRDSMLHRTHQGRLVK